MVNVRQSRINRTNVLIFSSSSDGRLYWSCNFSQSTRTRNRDGENVLTTVTGRGLIPPTKNSFLQQMFPLKKVQMERILKPSFSDCLQANPVGGIRFDSTSLLLISAHGGQKRSQTLPKHFLHKHLRWRFQQLAADNASCEHP